ncbi:Uncharacterised protein [Flavonifractor plautii]|uniref:Uncharacterized protein n=1 Tax=Flavonifractor plautii TaxID=292800 RepID=A0A174E2L5_FLAPL|nr:Uncharacterised protein [Flavonifractor plautii]
MHVAQGNKKGGHGQARTRLVELIRIGAHNAWGDGILQGDSQPPGGLLQRPVERRAAHRALGQGGAAAQLDTAKALGGHAGEIRGVDHIHRDSQRGPHPACCMEGAPHGGLLSGGGGRKDAHLRPLLPGPQQSVEHGIGAQAVVQPPAGDAVVLQLVHGIGVGDEIPGGDQLQGLRPAGEATVDVEIGQLDVGAHLAVAQQQAHNTGEPLPPQHRHPLTLSQCQTDAAGLAHLEVAVVGDVGHPEADLVDMSAQEHPEGGCAVDGGNHIPRQIGLHLRSLLPHVGGHLFLKGDLPAAHRLGTEHLI